MYSREKFRKAIDLYLKYDKSVATVIRELGYPSRKTLPRWYKRYLKEQETGIVRHRRRSKYSMEQKQVAVEYYFDHGHCLSRTVRALGYPSRQQLKLWRDELAPDTRKSRVGGVKYTREQKEDAVIALCTREGSAMEIAKDVGITRVALYNWKNSLLGKGACITMPKLEDRSLPDDKEALLSEIDQLKRQIRRLKLEKDILEGAVELIKKDPGIELKSLANREKAILVDALKNEYPLNELLGCLGMARSSYFYHRKIKALPDKYEELRRRIIELFHENCGRYGYRRIQILLIREEKHASEKVVRRIMSKSNLVVVGKKKRHYSSYQGESHPAADNLIDRDFHAEAPNIKWLTDITEFAIPAGKVFLSPIVDCFDGLVTSWSIGTSPNAELVNTMLDRATMTLKEGEHPLVHSDRGFHYRWPGWISRMKEAGLERSMSRKGCPPDNAACEGFFGRLKNEMFHDRSWIGVGIEEFMEILDKYLIWHNEKRIKLSLGGISPLEYRLRLGLAA